MSVLSGHGWAVAECQGAREYMEDFHVVSSFSDVAGQLGVFGVFDGHGGASVAEHCSRHMARRIAQLHFGGPQQHDAAGTLTAAFHATDDEAARDVRSRSTGSTACVAMVTPTTVWVANAGDSRAFVRTHAGLLVPLSEDHKPSTSRERERIERGGGVISYASGMARVGGLNLSRSIGDLDMRPHVVCTPDVHSWTRTGGAYLVVASDGVFDVLDSPQVAGILDGVHPSIGASLQEVVREARRRGSGDNITVMYVEL